MPEDLFDEPERRSAERLAAARLLASRGKLREALDTLNLAIQLWPQNPEAFRERAGVFERMGLVPQAEADRLRAAELAAAPPAAAPEEPPEVAPTPRRGRSRPRPDEPLEVPPAPEGQVETEQAQATAISRRERSETHPPEAPVVPEHVYGPIPADIPREIGRGPGLGAALFTIAIGIVLVVGIVGGVLLVLDLGGGDEPSPSATPFGATGVAEGEGSATETEEPTTGGSVSTSGDPYSLADVVSAWEGKGMEVKTGDASEGFTGFKTAPVDVSMTRGGSTSTTSVFVYKTREAALAEWDLVPGSRPAPKGDREAPSHVSAWWNANVVVILRSDPGGLGPDGLDGLINLGG